MLDPQYTPESLIRARRASLKSGRDLNHGIASPRPTLTRNTQPLHDANSVPRPLAANLARTESKLEKAKLLIEAAKNPSQIKRNELNTIGRVDLTGVDLTSLKDDLRYLPFAKVNLAGANMDGGNFRGADMRGINASGASFKGADLADAQLAGAHLDGAQFQGASLAGASLHAARAAETNFTNADALDAGFSQTNLAGAQLPAANLRGANLNHVNMTGIQARGADFSGSFGEGAHISGELQNAKFVGTRFTASSFGSGDYQGADFTRSVFTNPEGSLAFLRDVAPEKQPKVENTHGLTAAMHAPKKPQPKQWAGLVTSPSFV